MLGEALGRGHELLRVVGQDVGLRQRDVVEDLQGRRRRGLRGQTLAELRHRRLEQLEDKRVKLFLMVIDCKYFTHGRVVLGDEAEEREEGELLGVLAVVEDGDEGHDVGVDGVAVHRVDRREHAGQGVIAYTG